MVYTFSYLKIEVKEGGFKYRISEGAILRSPKRALRTTKWPLAELKVPDHCTKRNTVLQIQEVCTLAANNADPYCSRPAYDDPHPKPTREVETHTQSANGKSSDQSTRWEVAISRRCTLVSPQNGVGGQVRSTNESRGRALRALYMYAKIRIRGTRAPLRLSVWAR